jgi:large subunit ribosomal protein L6
MLSLNLPQKVSLTWGSDFVKVSGPLGVLVKKRSNFFLAEKDSILYLWTASNLENIERFYLIMLKRLIVGVSKGYRQRLRLVGVGFKAVLKEQRILLKIGYSHEVYYDIPGDAKILVSKAKGTYLLIKGSEKERVQQIAKEIRNLRQPDAYKGKGIHYFKEILRLKKGKKEGK